MKTLISIAFSMLSASVMAQEPQLGRDNIKDVVAAMTLEEKANMVMGNVRDYDIPPTPAPGTVEREAPNIEKIKKILKSRDNAPLQLMTAYSQGRVSGASGDGYSLERLAIPSLVYSDGPAGVRISATRPQKPDRTFYCTAFPTSATLAASWDTSVTRSVSVAIGEEARDYGLDILLAPAINIIRNPLGGRSFEYFSEDPVLAGKMGAAYIQGVQQNNVGVSMKHFAVNNQETYRNGINVFLSDRALREIYLKNFEIAVKEGRPWTIMSSYNRINGVFASENSWLLNDVLRKEWGFDGIVMTDWWSEEDGARQIASGNDLLMPGTQHQYDEIINAVREGRLDERLLDKAVENILKLILKSNSFHQYKYSEVPNLKAHAIVAREMATQGMVLLENDGILPLTKKNRSVALFGVGSYDTNIGGSGSGDVNRAYKISINEGLTNAGYRVDKKLAADYKQYVEKGLAELKKQKNYGWAKPIVKDTLIDRSMIDKAAKANDVAVVTIGRMAGEGGDRTLTKGDWYLSDSEMTNLRNVCDAFHQQGKKVVVLLNMGSILDMASWKDLPDAILHVWMPGQEAGNAVADVLTGKVSPSGKLPLTIAAKYEDYISAKNFPQSNNNPAEVRYDDDIWVGYRWFDASGIKPLYPFGYGLSYTSFNYSSLDVTSTGDGFDVTVTVKNTGKMEGRESVQIYVSAPSNPHMAKPAKELKAFAKTGLLKPGESETLQMHVSREELASWNTLDGGWVVDKGTYSISAGASSQNIVLQKTISL